MATVFTVFFVVVPCELDRRQHQLFVQERFEKIAAAPPDCVHYQVEYEQETTLQQQGLAVSAEHSADHLPAECGWSTLGHRIS
jgi:hypothetical protein